VSDRTYRPLALLAIIIALVGVLAYFASDGAPTADAQGPPIGTDGIVKIETYATNRGRLVRDDARKLIQTVYKYPGGMRPNGVWRGGSVDLPICCSPMPGNGAPRAYVWVRIHYKTLPWSIGNTPCFKQATKLWGGAIPVRQEKLIDCNRQVFTWLDPMTGAMKYNVMPWKFPLSMG
jgi:hypothetical protein